MIADDKLTRYLLVPREWDEKSGFLARAGFTPVNWTVLRCDPSCLKPRKERQS